MNKYLKDLRPNYDKWPYVDVSERSADAWSGWEAVRAALNKVITGKDKQLITVDYYPGVNENELYAYLIEGLPAGMKIRSMDLFKKETEIRAMTQNDVTDDPVFGCITTLDLQDFFDPDKLDHAAARVRDFPGTVLVYGYGASLLPVQADVHIYADMPRWELQLRYRRQEIANLGLKNTGEKASLQYKRGFFVDWRVADKHKKKVFENCDYLLDSTKPGMPVLVKADAYRYALQKTAVRPFRVLPFFDPGPWGGQWMKEICDLDRNEPNFAWCFDCVPEENSLALKFGDAMMETPAINLVFFQTGKLLGPAVQDRFGAEFPIRFDFLDTMEGGNLSLQVHPTDTYIRQKFRMAYTQDESYYILDAGGDASVYLGLREDTDPGQFVKELEDAQAHGTAFNADKHVAKWHVRKHDHFLIPAGTVHCSGKNAMVLEISATPYLFTFKLWDWGRMGLDGKPRPININHGKNVIDWNRREHWVAQNLVNRFNDVAKGAGWREEKTGLHESQFIETRRFWFSAKTLHQANGSVQVINLIEGREAIIESPEGVFDPFVVHYAETVIVPAAVQAYTITPYGESELKEIGIIKAFVKI